MDDVLCANANRDWFHTIFSLLNPGISPRQNWYFFGFPEI